MIEAAIKFALRAHAGQKQFNGDPYILHPLHVACHVDGMDEKAVALLHDTLEDSTITSDDLRQAGFAAHIVEAVELLTKPRPYIYEDYIRAIGKNPLARVVKMADLMHNMDLSRLPEITPKALNRDARYHQAYATLEALA